MGYSVQSIGQYSTWLPTYTGCSVDPIVADARYTLNGKMCMATVRNSVAGTSNATTKTITLPFNAANTSPQIGYIIVQDNGINRHGIIRTRAGSNIADMYLTNSTGVSLSPFTASGSWTCHINILFEIE